MSRLFKTMLGIVAGAIIGSSIGVAFGGDAYVGTLFVGILGGFFAVWITGGKQKRNPDLDVQDGASFSSQDALNDMEDTLKQTGSVIGNLLAATWNVFMQFFRAIGLMTYFRKGGWILIISIAAIGLIIPPLLILFIILGIVASDRGAKRENDFIIPVKEKF